MDVVKAELYEAARIVGSVFQNPRSQFFCVDTTSEIAFACENMGLPEETVKIRIREAARDMEIENLIGRSIFKLSGGEKQKVACASVSAAHPEVLILDEPTSNLDMDAIESLRRTIHHVEIARQNRRNCGAQASLACRSLRQGHLYERWQNRKRSSNE